MSDDRGAILARRRRFLIVALAGVGCASPPPATGGTKPEPQPTQAPPPGSEAPDDSDNDTIPDDDDRCPEVPEDRDGIDDGDGCPELDNDNDGVPDDVDKCPTSPGTKEGCPRPCLLILPDHDLQILEKVYFPASTAKIPAKAFPILDEVVSFLVNRPEFVIQVQGHAADGEDERFARDRAEAVRKYLLQKGIAMDRITIESFGARKPIDRVAEKNRRVEFHVEER
jgi:outer membrane protein OmpA-like peptidoglycan-associated protein